MDFRDRRRRKRPFDDFFDDDFFGGSDDFRSMHEHIQRIMREVFTNLDDIDPGSIIPDKKYVYGFSMHNGPDGKPIVSEFGNVPRDHDIVPGEREPLVEVIDGEDEVTVIAELPGVNKEDINLDADKGSLRINVDNESRVYKKDLNLPENIVPDKVTARYKNGILEVKMKKLRVESDKHRKKIEVE